MTRFEKLAMAVLNFFSPCFLLVAFPWAFLVRIFSKETPKNPRLVWGPAPILNNSHWSKAMKQAGFSSETYTTAFMNNINSREDWDRLVNEDYKFIPLPIRPYIAFLEALIHYDIFFTPFIGFFLGKTALWRFESILLKIARKKIVVLAYGSDSYIYPRIQSTSLLHGLLMSYPQHAKRATTVANKVDYWREHADVVIPGWIGFDGIGRWDVLVGSQLHIDTNDWKPAKKKSNADGTKGMVTITHTPNHRGFKGTEFIIKAVKNLQAEGLKVELNLVEGKQNCEVKQILTEETDILIEQLIFTGHGLSGVEGMASGTCVIANLEDEQYTLPVRRWSYFAECPIVSATPENIQDTLRKLITTPKLRQTLGKAGRAYTTKYHSYPAAQYMFKEVIEFLYGRKDTLVNLYHPILGEYNKKTAPIKHPLVKNKIVSDDI